MTTVVRYARMYYRLNVLAWEQLRKVAVPLLVLFGLASVVAYVIGVRIDNFALTMAPGVYAAVLFSSYSIARLP